MFNSAKTRPDPDGRLSTLRQDQLRPVAQTSFCGKGLKTVLFCLGDPPPFPQAPFPPPLHLFGKRRMTVFGRINELKVQRQAKLESDALSRAKRFRNLREPWVNCPLQECFPMVMIPDFDSVEDVKLPAVPLVVWVPNAENKAGRVLFAGTRTTRCPIIQCYGIPKTVANAGRATKAWKRVGKLQNLDVPCGNLLSHLARVSQLLCRTKLHDRPPSSTRSIEQFFHRRLVVILRGLDVSLDMLGAGIAGHLLIPRNTESRQPHPSS